MITLKFTITLRSDAELGTGLGTETINDLVPRNAVGIPVVPASHIKGLMRDELAQVTEALERQRDLVEFVFGQPNADAESSGAGRIRVSDAVMHVDGASPTRTITRTSLNESGTAKAGSLRTTEAVTAGAEFQGEVLVDGEPGTPLDVSSRMALLAISCVGGKRRRGSGACHITLEGESRTPGKLMKELLSISESGSSASYDKTQQGTGSFSIAKDSPPVLVKLVFQARDGVCCPETPVVKNNIISSGFAIPASAVQGALLTLLNRHDTAMASACFEHPSFRAWPMLPSALPEQAGGPHPFPVRVSLTHRISKLPLDSGQHLFKDSAIEPYDWREVPRCAPLKGAEGVLLVSEDSGTVQLWRSGDMPRMLRSHSAHNTPESEVRRGLFSVEAMAPMFYSGIAAVPEAVVDALLNAIESEPSFVAFGKARTVGGGGTLFAQRFSTKEAWMNRAVANQPVFIVQSPVALPELPAENRHMEAGDALGKLISRAGWGELDGHPEAAVCCRFGWNRHGHGDKVGDTRRLNAQLAIAPGAVFRLQAPPEDLWSMLVQGLGDGRSRGFGCLLPHPGIASSRFAGEPEITRLRSVDQAGQIGVELWRKAGKEEGPSASQIAAVAQRLEKNPEETLKYVDNQTKRSPRIWHTWCLVIEDVEKHIRNDAQVAARALRVWQDLAVSGRDKEEALS